MSFKHDGPKVLLTEGKNDCHVIASLCKYYDVPNTFGLNDCESDDLALKKLSALLARTDKIEAIGIVIDADKPNLDSKWQAITYRLKKGGITTIPNTPIKSGTIISATDLHPRVGVWLMPDNTIDGMLEDFCQNLADSKSIEFAENCVISAKEKKYTTFIDNHKTKAVIHTYLAWQDEPGMPLGQAITAKALNPENDLAKIFRDWLVQLFQIETHET